MTSEPLSRRRRPLARAASVPFRWIGWGLAVASLPFAVPLVRTVARWLKERGDVPDGAVIVLAIVVLLSLLGTLLGLARLVWRAWQGPGGPLGLLVALPLVWSIADEGEPLAAVSILLMAALASFVGAAIELGGRLGLVRGLVIGALVGVAPVLWLGRLEPTIVFFPMMGAVLGALLSGGWRALRDPSFRERWSALGDDHVLGI